MEISNFIFMIFFNLCITTKYKRIHKILNIPVLSFLFYFIKNNKTYILPRISTGLCVKYIYFIRSLNIKIKIFYFFFNRPIFDKKSSIKNKIIKR